MKAYSYCARLSALILTFGIAGPAALADHKPNHPAKGGGGDGCTESCEPPPVVADIDYDWMHSDVGVAHLDGWTGEGAFITVVDDFTPGDEFAGRLVDLDGDGVPDIEERTHGEWTSLQASLVAPGATVIQQEFSTEAPIVLHDGAFDAVNLSYGLIARAAFAGAFSDWSLLGQPHESIVTAAWADDAFVAKSAGNDGGVGVGETVKGTVDVLGQQLIGAPGVVFVGALEFNPEDGTQAAIASYSSIAGGNSTVQDQFLVVGVEGGWTDRDSLANYGSQCGSVPNGTCLYGTSFAAPIVAGYAAVVAHKFSTETSVPAPSDVAYQLLSTARTDTILNYDVSVHGQGEASLQRALSPDAIR